MLKRCGAAKFGYMSGETGDQIAFNLHGRLYRMTLPLADQNDQQAVRSAWRALVLQIKARLVAVESGITTVEREFLGDVVLANGHTAHEWLLPQLESNQKRMPTRMWLMSDPAVAHVQPPRLTDSVDSRQRPQ